jgi:glycosyltransferase involved in cell wall biosynthesis
MIITIVCDVLGEANNGTTIAALNLIGSMKRRGHEVRVVCADENRRGQSGCYIVPKLSLGPINGYIAKNGVSLAKADKRVLEQAIRGADVVHAMLPYSLGAGAAQVAKRLGVPLTAGCHALAENFTTHVFLTHCGLANRVAYKIYYHRLYKHCVCIHYPTQMMCDIFEDATQRSPHRVISNGVGRSFRPLMAEKPDYLKDRYVILFTGRYSKEKGHKLLIDGVSRSKYRDRIQLILAGAGPLDRRLKAYATRRLPVPPVFGFFPRGELQQLLGAADLYVHPARYEAEGIACLEAMASGKIILSSDSPKSAVRGFALSANNLFRCGCPDSLAQKIDYWIEHPEEKDKWAWAYARFARRFDFEKCMDEMEEMFYDAARTQGDLLYEGDGRLCGDEYPDAESGYGVSVRP